MASFSLFLGINLQAKNCQELYSEMVRFVLSPENSLSGEATLRAQGSGDDFVAGLDTVDDFLRATPALRRASRDTPSMFLGGRLEGQVDFVTEGHPDQIRFDSFRQKIWEKDYRKIGISHSDWVHFNYDLAQEASPPTEPWENHIAFTSLAVSAVINEYPKTIMAAIPGEIGIFSFNRTFLTGVFPFGLENAPRHTHGINQSPLRMMMHDGVHFIKVEKTP